MASEVNKLFTKMEKIQVAPVYLLKVVQNKKIASTGKLGLCFSVANKGSEYASESVESQR